MEIHQQGLNLVMPNKRSKYNYISKKRRYVRDQSLKRDRGSFPLGYGDGLSIRISILEGLIHDLALTGDSEGLYKVLKEYILTWVELVRGGAI